MYLTINSSVSMCGVVSYSSVGRVVAYSAGEGSGGSVGIVALVFFPEKNCSSNVLGSTSGVLFRGMSAADAAVFSPTPEILPLFPYFTPAIL